MKWLDPKKSIKCIFIIVIICIYFRYCMLVTYKTLPTYPSKNRSSEGLISASRNKNILEHLFSLYEERFCKWWTEDPSKKIDKKDVKFVFENNINYILKSYLIVYIFGLRWFFDMVLEL
jgi:hypothetical protein